MRIIEKEAYKIFEDEKDDVTLFAAFLESIHPKFKDDNVVIDILKYGNLSLDELLRFLELSNRHRQGKKSFVIANDTINIDQVPEELLVVPTLVEAEDIIQMEEIERDLGF
ncbi:ribonuclease Z [Salinimicrobium tongyeongense]|uniref:Ribonuclease Z n=1 Tax=Salinimicrobium tongyeongense TaxID=2809707 RepID=A0ABY6NS22_9FLAO|nr:ribonuclease Z [Salinimicrobium tongyeongense]UZH55710.1 ribonuclease Z [Salinimicrobium tongyeongense]